MNPYDADNWQEVESSNIAAVGTKDHFLIVKFNKGMVYRYANCAQQFGDLVQADSVGHYFATEIKSNYSYDRLPSEEVGWPDNY